MRTFSGSLAIVRSHGRAYAALNFAYYGLILAGLAWAQIDPGLAGRLRGAVDASLTGGSLAPVAQVYDSGAILAAIAVTLGLNLFIGSLASITLPSLVLPFSGLGVGGLRAFLWGLLFSPKPSAITLSNLPAGAVIAGLLFLEGQGYVLTMLAAWIQSRARTRPWAVGAATRREGSRMGLQITARLYPLVILTLAVAAVYEVMAATFALSGTG